MDKSFQSLARTIKVLLIAITVLVIGGLTIIVVMGYFSGYRAGERQDVFETSALGLKHIDAVVSVSMPHNL